MTTVKSYIHFTHLFQPCPGYLKVSKIGSKALWMLVTWGGWSGEVWGCRMGSPVYRLRANSALLDLKRTHLLPSLERSSSCCTDAPALRRSAAGAGAPVHTSLLHVVDDGQDAHLLLGGVRVFTLLLRHTGAQAVEPPTVFGIVYAVLKKQLLHPEERHSCQQGV